MIMRLTFMLLACLGLNACTQSGGDESAAGQLVGLLGKKSAFSARFTALQTAEASAIQVGFIDLEQNTIMLREARRDGIDTWIGPDDKALILENSMLRGTRGFGVELISVDISQPMAMVLGRREGFSDRLHTYLMGDNQALTRTYRCEIKNNGDRELTLGKRVAKTQLMRETCRSLDQSFFNLYWVEGGTIVQTRQWTGEFIGDIATQVIEK